MSRIERSRRSMHAARGVSDEMLDGQVRLGGTFRHIWALEISQFRLTAITKTYPNIATIAPLCILVPFAMGRVVCHICRPAEPCQRASLSAGRSGIFRPLPRPTTVREIRHKGRLRKRAHSPRRGQGWSACVAVSHQRQFRRRSADAVGFVQSDFSADAMHFGANHKIRGPQKGALYQ